MKERIKALAERFEGLKQEEAALKMKVGQFDDEVKKLAEELGIKNETQNLVVILNAVAAKL